jgi:hypothetical protein
MDAPVGDIEIDNGDDVDVDVDADADAEDGFVEVELPEYACTYCGLSDQACVVRCVESGKWFCNGRGNTSASHIIQVLLHTYIHTYMLHTAYISICDYNLYISIYISIYISNMYVTYLYGI